MVSSHVKESLKALHKSGREGGGKNTLAKREEENEIVQQRHREKNLYLLEVFVACVLHAGKAFLLVVVPSRNLQI